MMQVDYMEKTLSISGVISTSRRALSMQDRVGLVGRDRRLGPIGYSEASTSPRGPCDLLPD